MYITDAQMISQRLAMEGKFSQSDVIKHIIADDLANKGKQYMRVGTRYYSGEHDILEHDFTEVTIYDENGVGRVHHNKNNSNEHVVHNFFAHHVDQKTAYILGRPLSVSVEGANDDPVRMELQGEITAITTDERFADMLNRWVTQASCKGSEWVHVYYTKSGELRYTVAPAEGIIPFYDTDNQAELVELIRYWDMQVVQGKKQTTRKRVEWWTKDLVTVYDEDERGNYIRSNDYTPNPRPHWLLTTKTDGRVIKRAPMRFAAIPFVRLDNNDLCASDLQPIKSLQDAYNQLSSASTNNQIDLVELYWSVSGYGAETAGAIAKKLQLNHAVSVTDPNGKIDAKQVVLQTSERIAWMDMLRRDIYHIGRAFDESPERVGNATTVALKMQYTGLDLKADQLILKLKLALKELFSFFVDEINRKKGTAYDASWIRVDVNKSMLHNDGETIENLEKSTRLPSSIYYAKHPYVDDPDQAAKEFAAEQQEAEKRRADMYRDDDITEE